MTCTTCSDLDYPDTPKAPGFAARLFSALGRLRPAERLDLDSLSCHRLRDLGLADGRDMALRDAMRD
ncbi:MAG: hypothetical protein ACKVP5_23680 [Aestuariivirga sp.]